MNDVLKGAEGWQEIGFFPILTAYTHSVMHRDLHPQTFKASTGWEWNSVMERRGACSDGLGGHSTHIAGLMFWLRWKKFVGSYLAFIDARRA